MWEAPPGRPAGSFPLGSGGAGAPAPFSAGASPTPRKPGGARKLPSLKRSKRPQAEGGRGKKRRSLAKLVKAPRKLKSASSKLATAAAGAPRKLFAARKPPPAAPPATEPPRAPSSGGRAEDAAESGRCPEDSGREEAAEEGRRRPALAADATPARPLGAAGEGAAAAAAAVRREAAVEATGRPTLETSKRSPVHVVPTSPPAARDDRLRSPEPDPRAQEDLASPGLSLASNLSLASSCSEGYRTFLGLIGAAADDRAPDRSVRSLLDGVEVSAHEEALEVVVSVTAAADPPLTCGCLATLLESQEKLAKPVPGGWRRGGGAEGDLDGTDAGSMTSIRTADAQVLVCDRSGNAEIVPSGSAPLGNADVVRAPKSVVDDAGAACQNEGGDDVLRAEQPGEVPEGLRFDNDACSIPSVYSVEAPEGSRIDEDACSIPSVCSRNSQVAHDSSRNFHELSCSLTEDGFTDNQVPQVDGGVRTSPGTTHAKEAADSALMWGCMTALLGAPAPKCVLLGEKKSRRRTPANLWQEDVVVGDLDDVVSPSEGDGLDGADDCSMPSLLDQEEQDGLTDLAFPPSAPLIQNADDKEPNLLRHQKEAATIRCASMLTRKKLAQRDSISIDRSESSCADVLLLDLHELEAADNDDTCFVGNQADVKEQADSALAWGALGMLLGSAAPTSVPKNESASRQTASNFWSGEATGNDCSETIPSLQEHKDDAGSIASAQSEEPLDVRTGDHLVLSLDLHELEAADSNDARFVGARALVKEGADAAVAWGALGMLLGSAAPESVPKKESASRQTAPNLLSGEATGQECSETIPSLEENEDDTGSISSAQSEEPLDVDTVDCPREFLLESESNAVLESNTAEKAVDSVMAWSALAALLAAPAPPSVARKKTKPTNLWDDDDATDKNLDDLLSCAQDDISCEDTKKINEENAKQGHLHVQVFSHKGFERDVGEDTDSVPSLSATNKSSSSSPLTLP